MFLLVFGKNMMDLTTFLQSDIRIIFEFGIEIDTLQDVQLFFMFYIHAVVLVY